MGIFGRIRQLFRSCFRPSTSSVYNDENSRLSAPTVHSTQDNLSTQESTSKVNSYGSINNISVDPTVNRIRDSVTNTSQYGSATSSQLNGDAGSYYLQTFICNVNSSLQGKPTIDVIYSNEWTPCTAVILDEFAQPMTAQHTVKLTGDSRVQFRDCKLQNGCICFSMKAPSVETITVFLHIKKYTDITNSITLSKTIQVSDRPPTAVQPEMTIKTIKRIDASSENEIVFQVSTVDIFGQLSCYEFDVQLSGENRVIQRQLYSESGHIYFDVTVRGEAPWSKNLVVMLNGVPVPNERNIDVPAKLRGLCSRALKSGDYESIPDFIGFHGTRFFIPVLTGDDDGKFVPYDENTCELLPGAASLLCKSTKRDDIIGAGCAHINNISRVLHLKHPIDINEIPGETIVIINLSNLQSPRYQICKEVVQHLLRGLYYRSKASQAQAIRMEWKNRNDTLLDILGTSPSSRLCMFFKDHFGTLLSRYNREACDELFNFFNFQQGTSKVDLHGLYVADDKKLELQRERMLRARKHRDEADIIIRKWKSEGDEAIRKLEETLEKFDLDEATKRNTPWLEIIVGAGRHSRIKNQQNIRPKVEKLLKERNLEFTAVNKGALVVTFITYSGPEPCFGEYYCENCDQCWKNSESYVGECQKCSLCQVNCWPVKQRKEEKVDRYYRYYESAINSTRADAVKTTSKPHQHRYKSTPRRRQYKSKRHQSIHKYKPSRQSRRVRKKQDCIIL